MFNTVIIEDDPFQMQIICDLIATSFPQLAIVGKGALSSEGITIIRDKRPDLILLDIDLPDKSGFEMLMDLQDMHFDIIFVTAYEKYALEAHQFGATGYLIKPITKDRLQVLVDKLNGKRKNQSFGEQVQTMLTSFRSNINKPQKIAVPSLKEIHYLNIYDILRLEADGNYTTLFLSNGKQLTSSRQIGEFEEKLVIHNFFRIHDKHLVNLRSVKSFLKGESGTAIMEDNTQLPVARRRKEEFLNLLNDLFL